MTFLFLASAVVLLGIAFIIQTIAVIKLQNRMDGLESKDQGELFAVAVPIIDPVSRRMVGVEVQRCVRKY